MRKALALLTLSVVFASASAFAEGWSTKVSLLSIGMWRGLPVTNHGVPQLIGSSVYQHDSGFYLGGVIQNVNSVFGLNNEAHVWAGYQHKFDDAGSSISGEIMRYGVPEKTELSTAEIRAKLAWNGVNALLGYMPQYFWGYDADWTKNWGGNAEKKPAHIYFNANYAIPFIAGSSLVPDFGYSWMSTPKWAGFNNYMHYGISVRTMSKDGITVDLSWSGSNRKVLNPVSEATATSWGQLREEGAFLRNWGMPYDTGTPAESLKAHDDRFFVKVTKAF